MNIDQELRDALRRTAPPAGFADRVMSRIGTEERKRTADRRWLLRTAASILIIASLSLAGHGVAEKQKERREGEAAKEQLLLALKITAEKTTIAKSAVSRTSAD